MKYLFIKLSYIFIGDYVKKIIITFLLTLIIIPKNINAISDSATASIVMDIDSGRILYQKNSNSEMLIASTTKIMTFLIALEYASDRLDEKVVVGDEVLTMYGTNMYITLDEELKLIDLLYGLMLRSGNDASVVIATNIAGSVSDFVYLMNEKAKEIGMINSNFKNPHGLDEETKNYSTAYDLAILTRYLYLNYPLYKEISGTKYYDFKSNFKSYSLTNRSKIIFTYKNITTAKNGYTPLAGKSLVTTASNNDLNLLIVTLDDPNIYENHKNLYEYYFNNYKNHLILDTNNFKIDGNLLKENYFIKNSFSYPLTKEEIKKVTTKIIVSDDTKNILGKVNIILNDKVIHEEKIYKKETKQALKKESMFKKIINFLKKLLNNLTYLYFKIYLCYD